MGERRGWHIMGKRYNNLIERIASIENLREAYRKTALNKTKSFGYLDFREYDEVNLLRIREAILAGAWQQGEYRQFIVYEPKARLISALDFKDRLVQHALVNVVGDIFDNALMPNTFACRTGLGTHAGVCFVQSQLRKTEATHFLKTDYAKFFPSIDLSVLHAMIENKIVCDRTMNLIRSMVPATGFGLPIGSLTSQIFANLYGNAADRFLHFNLGHRAWARYMDDIVVVSKDAGLLKETKTALTEFSASVLKLTISKWQVSPVNKGINFLGYRIWPTHKLLRKSSVTRAKRKIANYSAHNEQDRLTRFIASWKGHASWADSHNLLNHLESHYALN